MVAMTGSPRALTEITPAGRYFKDQLMRVWPQIVGTAARAAKVSQSVALYRRRDSRRQG